MIGPDISSKVCRQHRRGVGEVLLVVLSLQSGFRRFVLGTSRKMTDGKPITASLLLEAALAGEFLPCLLLNFASFGAVSGSWLTPISFPFFSATTDPQCLVPTRYLQEWVKATDVESWGSAADLVSGFYTGSSGSDVVEQAVKVQYDRSGYNNQMPPEDALRRIAAGVRTLLLTQLNRKIRLSVADNSSTKAQIPMPDKITESVWSGLVLLGASGGSGEVIQLCATLSALAVQKNGGVKALVHRAASPDGLEPMIALKLLERIPCEAIDCNSRTESQIVSDMNQCVALVIAVVGKTLSSTSFAKLALDALSNWAKQCHITLSQLSVSVNEQGLSMMRLLLSILTQRIESSLSFDVVVGACQVLMISVLDSTDYGTPSRSSSVCELLAAFPSIDFSGAASLDGSDDVLASLANLASALATQEIDLVAQCNTSGCSELIEILLQLQKHPNHVAAIAPLEVWLAIQDVPVSCRHSDLSSPLFGSIVQSLMSRASYPPQFVSWEKDDGNLVDRQEFEEFRSLSADVLVSAYYLMNEHYVSGIVAIISGSSAWETTESALWGLCVAGKDISKRLKSKPKGSDVQKTAQLLLDLAQKLCAISNFQEHHPVLLSSVAHYLGSFAPVWNAYCAQSESIIDVLSYLRMIMNIPGAVNAAAKATRQVLLGCSRTLVAIGRKAEKERSRNLVLQSMTALMETVLTRAMSDGVGDDSRLVAEGCCRVCVNMMDDLLVQRSICAIVEPILRLCKLALADMATAEHAPSRDVGRIEGLSRGISCMLGALEEVIRFSESSLNLRGALDLVLPLLNDTLMRSTHENITAAALNVQSALMSNAPDLVLPHFQHIVSSAVLMYDQSKNDSALDFIGSAAETFGSVENFDTNSFTELLTHINRITMTYLTTQSRPSDCPLLIESYFGMLRRFVMHMPQAVSKCPDLNQTVQLGVACLAECQGRDARAIVNFLELFLGYSQLRLSPSVSAAFRDNSSSFDEAILRNCEAICAYCLTSLTGEASAPQILVPAISNCLFVLILFFCSPSSPPAVGGEAQIRQLLSRAMTNVSASRMGPETQAMICETLIRFAKEGKTRKSRANMFLADVVLVSRGDARRETLLTYIQ